MWLEVEQKFWVDDLAAIREQFARLGATFDDPRQQVDQYFAHPVRDFAQTDEALRIRRSGSANFVTYKGPKLDATTKTRREIELPITSGDEGYQQFEELLLALDFRPVAAVRKRRQVAVVQQNGHSIEVSLDEVDGVGTFVELEVSAEQHAADAARNAIASLANRLGLTRNERRSYLELLLAV